MLLLCQRSAVFAGNLIAAAVHMHSGCMMYVLCMMYVDYGSEQLASALACCQLSTAHCALHVATVLDLNAAPGRPVCVHMIAVHWSCGTFGICLCVIITCASSAANAQLLVVCSCDSVCFYMVHRCGANSSGSSLWFCTSAAVRMVGGENVTVLQWLNAA
jgi:hypothetical protein